MISALASRIFHSVTLVSRCSALRVVKENKYKNFSHVPLRLATDYAAADAHQTLKFIMCSARCLNLKKISRCNFMILKCHCCKFFLTWRYRAFCLIKRRLKDLDMKRYTPLAEIEDEIIEMVGEKYANINLNAPRQIEELLFEHLKLPRKKRAQKARVIQLTKKCLRLFQTYILSLH